MHAGLAGMYVADPRFTEHFEKRGEGLATFVREAILANAARRRKRPVIRRYMAVFRHYR